MSTQKSSTGPKTRNRRTRFERRRFGPGSAGLLLTPEEFDAISYDQCNKRFRYELIRGVLVVSPMAGRSQTSPNDYLAYLLWNYHRNSPPGFGP